ncbi:MAG: redoxin domain-containing protein [Streptomyces sp.]|jgi:peroxiredoxin|nr:redoxin domain-containing protein [Streptomyces sp.]
MRRRLARWKRHFVLPYFGGNAVAFALAGLGLVTGGPVGPLCLALLAHGAPLALLSYLYAGQRQGRTSVHLWPLQLTVYAATTALAAWLPRSLPWFASAAVLAAGLSAAYVYWYSRLDAPGVSVLQVGRPMPEVPFEEDSHRITTGDLRGRPVAYLFLRGNWCPLCMAQARTVAQHYQELEALGAEVALVSPQDEEQTRELARQLGVRFRYLRDPGLRAARALGIHHDDGVPVGIPGYDPDTVLPTVVVTDADGTVVFVHQSDNYRVRPTPDTILTALHQATSAGR